MPNRDHAPVGSPTWAELWTSDVERTRRFYAELFGWEAGEPSPEFGGYFMFTRQGVPVAGCMGPAPDMPEPTNAWTLYLTTDDVETVLKETEARGGEVVTGSMPIADLGIMAVLRDPSGAEVGAWQPLGFPGFTVLAEPGTPAWFELHTRDHGAATAYYAAVFGWQLHVASDTDDFRYTMMADPAGDGDLAGIMDASHWLPDGAPAHWSIYWAVDDIDATVARLGDLGGSVVMAPEDTPYGRLATVTDPAGAVFKLHMQTG